jgi:hypothetical protein
MDARGGVGGSDEPHELPDDREIPCVLRLERDRLERRVHRQELGPEKGWPALEILIQRI